MARAGRKKPISHTCRTVGRVRAVPVRGGCLLSLLPLVIVWYLGRFCGTLAYFVGGGYRRLALNNLRIAFGAEKSELERRQIGPGAFQELIREFPLRPEDATHA